MESHIITLQLPISDISLYIILTDPQALIIRSRLASKSNFYSLLFVFSAVCSCDHHFDSLARLIILQLGNKIILPLTF